jgi:hypothetical protein
MNPSFRAAVVRWDVGAKNPQIDPDKPGAQLVKRARCISRPKHFRVHHADSGDVSPRLQPACLLNMALSWCVVCAKQLCVVCSLMNKETLKKFFQRSETLSAFFIIWFTFAPIKLSYP